MSVTKEHLNKLIDQLSDEDISHAYEFLKKLAENESKDAHIPYDDEPLTDEEIKAIENAELEYRQGRTIKFEDIKSDLQN